MEGLLEFTDHLVSHDPHRPEGPAIDKRLGRRFQNLQTVNDITERRTSLFSSSRKQRRIAISQAPS